MLVRGLHFVEAGITEVDDNNDDNCNNDDESTFASSVSSKTKAYSKEHGKPLLPHHHTKELVFKMKLLTQRWAEEEQIGGNNIHCKFVS